MDTNFEACPVKKTLVLIPESGTPEVYMNE